jgi:hypothetical protein
MGSKVRWGTSEMATNSRPMKAPPVPAVARKNVSKEFAALSTIDGNRRTSPPRRTDRH